MKLVEEFIIKDLFGYMISNDIDILEELEQCNTDVVIDLIKLGNKCSDEEAEELYDRAVNELGFEKFIEELAYSVVGKEPTDNNDNVDRKEFTTFLDVLESFYNEIQSVDKNLTLTEFMNMNTRFMYKYADGVQKRYVNDTNAKWRDLFMDKVMLGQMLSGKLKDCPQLNEDGTMHKESEIDKIKAFFAMKQKGV